MSMYYTQEGWLALGPIRGQHKSNQKTITSITTKWGENPFNPQEQGVPTRWDKIPFTLKTKVYQQVGRNKPFTHKTKVYQQGGRTTLLPTQRINQNFIFISQSMWSTSVAYSNWKFLSSPYKEGSH